MFRRLTVEELRILRVSYFRKVRVEKLQKKTSRLWTSKENFEVMNLARRLTIEELWYFRFNDLWRIRVAELKWLIKEELRNKGRTSKTFYFILEQI